MKIYSSDEWQQSRHLYSPALNSFTEMACMAYMSGELQNSHIVQGWICTPQ
jgi:hypothetical protein